MSSEEPNQSDADMRQLIGLKASALVAESIKSSLRSERVSIEPLEALLEQAGASADLVICELGDEDAALERALLTADGFKSTPILFIGPAGSALVQNREQVYELSADVSVSEVLRLTRKLLFGAQSIAPAPSAQRGAPISVLPKISEPVVSSRPSPPVNSSPAPLLPSSAPPSSRPSGRTRHMPTIPPTLAGRPSDELASPPSELSVELAELLNEAEQRVAEELRPRPSAPTQRNDEGMLALSPEIEAALADPIGELGLQADALTPNPRTGTGSGNRTLGSEEPPGHRPTGTTADVVESKRATSASVAMDGASPPSESGSTLNHERFGPVTTPPPPRYSSRTAAASEPPVSPKSGTPLPGPITARPPHALTQEKQDATAGPQLPPAPGLPKDDWVGKALPDVTGASRGHDGGSVPTPPPSLTNPDYSLDSDSLNLARTSARFSQRAASNASIPLPPETSRPPARRSLRESSLPPSDKHTQASSERFSQGQEAVSPGPYAVRIQRLPRESTGPGAGNLDPTDPPEGPISETGEATGTGVPRSETGSDITSEPPEVIASDKDESSAEQVTLQGDAAIRFVAQAIRRRKTGVLEFEAEGRIRRVVLRDGDLVTAASSAAEESLLAHLIQRGELAPEIGEKLGHRVAAFGRHAGAALIAAGHLPQDQLWPVLRSHAEFVVGLALTMTTGVGAFEENVPARLQAEPSVFGGATGSEVFVELMQRVVTPEQALQRLGGPATQLAESDSFALLEECALSEETREALERALQVPLGEALELAPEVEFPCVLYALNQLEVIVARRSPSRSKRAAAAARDHLDDQAIRQAILRRRALVDNGDYFALLGVPRNATGYDIRRAYLELRRSLEPSLVLTAANLDLSEDLDLVREVITEAYDILRDQTKRDRYRRAIESLPV